MQLSPLFIGNHNFNHLLIVGKGLMKNLEFQMAVESFMILTVFNIQKGKDGVCRF